MYEFDKYEYGRHSAPLATLSDRIRPLPDVEKLSFMVWGEHCIECAAPQCYATCDLYDPRPDMRCRRFEYGTCPNTGIATTRTASAEIVFKKWGKLEARGNTFMLSRRKVLMLEKAATALCPVTNAIGSVVRKATGRIEWSYLSFVLLERLVYHLRKYRPDKDLPSGFLLEIYNPNPVAARLKLLLSINRSRLPAHLGVHELPQPFAQKLDIDPGFFRKFIPTGEMGSIISSGLAFDISLTPEEDERLHLVFISLDFVTFSEPIDDGSLLPVQQQLEGGPDVKCVVFDLDNTLWQGVLLEDEDAPLRAGMIDLIQTLDKRGILLSIASKNAHEHAWAKLKSLGIDEYFLYPKINWMAKSVNIKQIAKDLNIGLDTFLFIDDNPFELQEVKKSLPEVSCIHIDNLPSLADNPRLKGGTTEDARNRRGLYRQSALRHQEQEAFGDDYTEFLRSCRIVVTVAAFTEEDFDRVSELVQRTNQLNFSGRKYDRSQIRSIIDQPLLDKWTITTSDKFGSYGTVGFCISRRQGDTLEIQDFMLSCRVQGKFIEQALFSFLVKNQTGAATTSIRINFHPTEKNQPAQQILNQLGFRDDPQGGKSLSLTDNRLDCDFISTNTRAILI